MKSVAAANAASMFQDLARWLSVILSIRPRVYAGQLVNITKLSEKAE
jgi:hypothetical protein